MKKYSKKLKLILLSTCVVATAMAVTLPLVLCHGKTTKPVDPVIPAEHLKIAEGLVIGFDEPYREEWGTHLQIPDGAWGIKENCFQNCNIKSVDLPSTVATIQSYAFAGCPIEKVTIDPANEELEIKELGSGGIVVQKGDQTLSILGCLAYGDISFEDISLISGIPSFHDCAGITSVNLTHITSLSNDYLFSNCSNLRVITGEDSLINITGDKIFQNTHIENFNIAASVSSIGEMSFEFATFDSITCSEENSDFKIFHLGANGGALVDKTVDVWTDTTVAKGECAYGTVDFPTNPELTSIKGFGYTGIKSLITHDNITNITGTFSQSHSLTSITLSKNLATMPYNCFASCPLAECIITDNSYFHLLSLGSGFVLVPISTTHFTNASVAVGRIAFGNLSFQNETGLTAIAEEAFYECSGILSVNFSGLPSLSTISASSFSQCANLSSIISFGSINSIGYRTFQNCSNLSSMPPLNNISLDEECFMGTGLKSVDLSSCGTTLPESLFSYCTSLETVVLPTNLIQIGNSCFSLTAIKKITIPGSLTTIGDRAFSNCIYLKNIDLKNTSISNIPDYCFDGNTMLESALLPDTCTEFGVWAFHGCDSLKQIPKNDSDSVTTFGMGCFYGCGSFTVITLPHGLNIVGQDAFQYNYSLYQINASFIEAPTGFDSGAFASIGSLISQKYVHNENANYTSANFLTFLETSCNLDGVWSAN